MVSRQCLCWLIHCVLMTPCGDIDLDQKSSGNSLLPNDTRPLPEPILSSHQWCFRIPGIAISQRDTASQWRHSGRDDVSNHQSHDCLFNRLFGRITKKTSKLRVSGLCAGNSPWTGEFPAQMTSNAENVSIWWRHHGVPKLLFYIMSFQ